MMNKQYKQKIKKSESVSAEESALFRQAMAALKPISPREEESVAPPKVSFYLSDYYQQTVHAGSILSFCHSSISKRRFLTLKKGLIAWQAKLDLHGYSSAIAKDLLVQFIFSQATQGSRCLLIVHGKGGRHGEPPILKNLVNLWLPQFPQVLAFHSAQLHDGGAGALYALIRSNPTR